MSDTTPKAKYPSYVYDLIQTLPLCSDEKLTIKFTLTLEERLDKHLAELTQAWRDGIWNISPLIFLHEKNPKELKDLYKEDWRIVCKMSYDQTKFLLNKFKVNCWDNYSYYSEHTISRIVRQYAKKPWLFEGEYSIYHPCFFEWIKESYLKEAPFIDTYLDTRRMLAEEGKEISSRWSIKRLRKEHDDVSKRILTKQSDPTQFKNYTRNLATIKKDGYTATLLDSPLALAQEGQAMKHCVASYSEHCKLGNYMVFSITNENGDRISTLGVQKELINFKWGGEILFRWRNHQHYGACNSVVIDKKAKELAGLICYVLNDRTFSAVE